MSLTRALIYHPKPAVLTTFPLSLLVATPSIHLLRLNNIQPSLTVSFISHYTSSLLGQLFGSTSKMWPEYGHVTISPTTLWPKSSPSLSQLLSSLFCPLLYCGQVKYGDKSAITTTKSDQVSHVLRTHRWLPISYREKPKALQWPMRPCVIPLVWFCNSLI